MTVRLRKDAIDQRTQDNTRSQDDAGGGRRRRRGRGNGGGGGGAAAGGQGRGQGQGQGRGQGRTGTRDDQTTLIEPVAVMYGSATARLAETATTILAGLVSELDMSEATEAEWDTLCTQALRGAASLIRCERRLGRRLLLGGGRATDTAGTTGRDATQNAGRADTRTQGAGGQGNNRGNNNQGNNQGSRRRNRQRDLVNA